MEPINGRFLRIDYTLPRPVRGPKGGRLTKFESILSARNRAGMGTHLYVSQFELNFEAKAAFRTIRQNYKAVITEATFFFASPRTGTAICFSRALNDDWPSR